jgi:hypothetical protein
LPRQDLPGGGHAQKGLELFHGPSFHIDGLRGDVTPQGRGSHYGVPDMSFGKGAEVVKQAAREPRQFSRALSSVFVRFPLVVTSRGLLLIPMA